MSKNFFHTFPGLGTNFSGLSLAELRSANERPEKLVPRSGKNIFPSDGKIGVTKKLPNLRNLRQNKKKIFCCITWIVFIHFLGNLRNYLSNFSMLSRSEKVNLGNITSPRPSASGWQNFSRDSLVGILIHFF